MKHYNRQRDPVKQSERKQRKQEKKQRRKEAGLMNKGKKRRNAQKGQRPNGISKTALSYYYGNIWL